MTWLSEVDDSGFHSFLQMIQNPVEMCETSQRLDGVQVLIPMKFPDANYLAVNL